MRVGVVADDLTGANATGVKLSKQGLFSATFLGNETIPDKDEEMAACIDTDTRYVSYAISKKRVQEALIKFRNWNADLICKRIDSTLRGNIGCELNKMLETLGNDAVTIVSPSYPESGRVTIGGFLLVDNMLVQDTDVANDPVQPLKSSYVPHLLEDQSNQEAALITLQHITQGSEVIQSELERFISKGFRVIVCDAISEKHIDDVAYAMSKIKSNKLIPVDPGPLTSCYINYERNKEGHKKTKNLITIGSVTSVTTEQIKYLLKELKIHPIIVHPDKLATFSNLWEKEVNRAVQEGEKLLGTQSFLLVTTNTPDHNNIVDLAKTSAVEGVSKDLLAKRITEGLAEISRKLIVKSNNKINKCLFSGGDVTASFCEIVGANGIDLKDEVMPLVAYGQLLGGEFDSLSVVTKGGMVGDHTALFDSIKFLQSLA
ncbi:Uncharacterized conserved protein YgbK, DUF1537 family [Lentibacillus halodurans]|uniref:Uncharacterized conserved protein YgbK, DUF1537 family n=1 Tax=Lentibacillus halodurans TaxID=237679 RepID=A0A1I0XKM5_9BACI|nr:four-carbon acid sugar kinase family protein [Lentibacillus halodurans]SFB01552.1 Uncharacterized conserved protein YgbK, DUF1537 family [Lentibacillus halodurans]